MSRDIRIWRLRNRRRRLDKRLRQELGRPVPDPLAVQDLRRRDLQAYRELVLAEAVG